MQTALSTYLTCPLGSLIYLPKRRLYDQILAPSAASSIEQMALGFFQLLGLTYLGHPLLPLYSHTLQGLGHLQINPEFNLFAHLCYHFGLDHHRVLLWLFPQPLNRFFFGLRLAQQPGWSC